jgi:hypothetical protein
MDCFPTEATVQPQESAVPAQDTCPRGYTCTCPDGFFGDNCETDEDYCLSSPCQNNGTCHDVMGGPGYNCTCPTGYTGVNCEEDIDECAEGICENGGTCTVSSDMLVGVCVCILIVGTFSVSTSKQSHCNPCPVLLPKYRYSRRTGIVDPQLS